MEIYKLINRSSDFNKGWELYKESSLIASTFNTDLPSITFSDEVAKELGIVDISEKGKHILINNMRNKNNGEEFNNSYAKQLLPIFMLGYNQALSDNKDKLFTANEIYEKIAFWFGRGVLAGKENRVSELMPNRKKIIQSLIKQEYEVELEAHEIPVVSDKEYEEISTGKLDYKECNPYNIYLPKITNNSVKVIKLLK